MKSNAFIFALQVHKIAIIIICATSITVTAPAKMILRLAFYLQALYTYRCVCRKGILDFYGRQSEKLEIAVSSAALSNR